MDPQATQFNIMQGLQTGGFAIGLIAGTGVIALGLMMERTISLFSRLSIDGKSFMAEIQTYILNNDLDGALRVCNGAKTAALPQVMKAGLMRASRSEDQIQNALDATALEVIPQIEKNLPFLAMIANVATLFGLFGTIVGLIRSFASLANADAAMKQAMLSAGIAEAMLATACGLLVAIATMIVHSILAAKASRLVAEIDEYSVKLLDLLSARKVQHSSEK
jgi:biopolymer transport protein ExbB/TolQ